MKTTTLVAAVLTAIADDVFGQTAMAAPISGPDMTASVMNAGVTAQQTSEGPSARPPAPGGSGILIGTAVWTAAGMSSQFDSNARLGQSASMQPALGRGLARLVLGNGGGREKP